ncbi:MHYT domain-containing protein [Loktanella agnita]|uniref:MHYT domain-containing protein n=1 Tax=Loktanella agnita TaxID=287097 RepID=UPI0039889011
MGFLEASHHPSLVAASFIVALAAGFTGLTLTRDLSSKTLGQRKLAIAMAAIALGGGIWSMHFVAMLGLQLPILFYYDSALTLASALLAVLMVGTALILLHFLERTPLVITISGGIVGLGVLSMHYLGMAGLELCQAVYTPWGLGFVTMVAVVLCIAAFWVAYGQLSRWNILLGTLCFATAVFTVHFTAVGGTNFVTVPSFDEVGPVISNEVLALAVIMSSFVIFGAFLWVGIAFLVPQTTPAHDLIVSPRPLRIPCEKDGRTLFIDPADIAFLRAEGHYTQVYTHLAHHFCIWSMTEATKRLKSQGFLKVHRSYLVNPAHVQQFERLKDNGLCRFDIPDLPPVPVSRANLKVIRAALGV